MGEPRNLASGKMEWTDDPPGTQVREAIRRKAWCKDGHRGYVVSGEYAFDDGREPLRAAQDEAYFLPPSDLGIGTYRDRNTAPRPARLFLIDD